jgi:hypothetical protein
MWRKSYRHAAATLGGAWASARDIPETEFCPTPGPGAEAVAGELTAALENVGTVVMEKASAPGVSPVQIDTHIWVAFYSNNNVEIVLELIYIFSMIVM